VGRITANGDFDHGLGVRMFAWQPDWSAKSAVNAPDVERFMLKAATTENICGIQLELMSTVSPWIRDQGFR